MKKIDELYIEKLKREQRGNINYYKPFDSKDSEMLRLNYERYLCTYYDQIIQSLPLFVLNNYGEKILLNNQMISRIVIGDYGAYAEFDSNNLCAQLEPIFKTAPTRPVKYIGYTIKNTNIKVYFQQGIVSYADYKPGKFYIDVKYIFFEHHEVLNKLSDFEEYEKQLEIKRKERTLKYNVEDSDLIYNALCCNKNIIETGNPYISAKDLDNYSQDYKDKNNLSKKDLSEGQQEAVNKIQHWIAEILGGKFND